jgi:phosphatidylinositol alpha-1,6-mannosyltransferase
MANRTLPSGDVEGFGMVFLEASAAGLPVIGGRSGGVVDAVLHGETGFLVDGSSVPDITDALQLLLDDPALRERLGARGREFARSRFSWEIAAAQVRELSSGTIDPRRWSETPGRDSILAPVADEKRPLLRRQWTIDQS